MIKRAQKRRPKPKDGTVLKCSVCGDMALGYNFDVISCESCKAFFRRNALTAKTFKCTYESNCNIDTLSRKFCSSCRLKKCMELGMKKELILTDNQLQKRRENKITKQKIHRYSGDVCPQTSTLSLNATNNASDSTSDVSLDSQPLDQSEESLEARVELEEFEAVQALPDDVQEELKVIRELYSMVFDAPYSPAQSTTLQKDKTSSTELFNMADLFIRRFVQFAKKIPAFKQLCQEDQICLIKEGIMTLMVLRSAMSYSVQDGGWVYKAQQNESASNTTINSNIMSKVQGMSVFHSHYRFIMRLKTMCHNSPVILLLLLLVELFSPDRHNLKDKRTIGGHQDRLAYILECQLRSMYRLSEARRMYPRLLMMLVELRDVGETNSQIATNLNVDQMEPLLVEVFNMKAIHPDSD